MLQVLLEKILQECSGGNMDVGLGKCYSDVLAEYVTAMFCPNMFQDYFGVDGSAVLLSSLI